jgi:dinuclear metal center YbgI/SA1388 family protein
MADLNEIVEHLEMTLRVSEIEDYPGAWNGLQVDGRSPVDKVCVATDACLATIEGTAAAGGQLLVVHHGLFWGDPLPLVGRSYRRIRALMAADIALYSVHLPLDIHPVLGNNALLARQLRLSIEGRFGTWKSVETGVWAVVDRPLNDFVADVEQVCEGSALVLRGGPPHVRRLAIVTGGGGSMIQQAHTGGFDTLLTGEGGHHTYHEAMEYGMNVIYAGHYATETLGVRAVGESLADRFGVEWEFIDHPTGM